MNTKLLVAASILAFTLAGYFYFPGHTYLYADTQVYVPILERSWDSTVLRHDLLAQHPHVSFTIYDEVSAVLRRLTGLDLEGVLTIQQLVFRALGILGVFLIASSLGLSIRMALLVAGIYSLGATVGGPVVLTFEYEPIPRGFAVPLIFLAIGFAAHGRDLAAGIAGAASFLYQAPAGYTFWAAYFLLALLPARPAVMIRRMLGLWPLLAAVLMMLFLSRLQPGSIEPQPFFGQIEPKLEELQRLRAPYNWVSMWRPMWYWHYAFLLVVTLGACFRLRKFLYKDLQYFVVGMPLLGILSLPLSYIALEKLKWILIPQIQPMRAVLFIAVFALVLAASAGIKAAQSRRFPESFLWFAAALAIPINSWAPFLFSPDLASPTWRRRALIVLFLSCAAALVSWADAHRNKWPAAAWAAFVLVPFFLIPTAGQIRNYSDIETPALGELSAWARASTPKDAIFLFPDAGKQLEPGIFRGRALRAVYSDWKTGGQVNFFPHLADEWWKRWQLTMEKPFTPEDVGRFAGIGIDFIVVQPKNRLPSREPVFQNPGYVVYRTIP